MALTNTRGTSNSEGSAVGMIAYDCTLYRPGCAIIQAGMGGSNNDVTCQFPTELWLTAPTPNMRLYPIANASFLQALINKSIEMNPQLMLR